MELTLNFNQNLPADAQEDETMEAWLELYEEYGLPHESLEDFVSRQADNLGPQWVYNHSMDYLEYVDKLLDIGVYIKKAECELILHKVWSNIEFRVNVTPLSFTTSERDCEPRDEALKYAMDLDSWKHSWHIETIPANFEKIRDILIEKVMERAKQVVELNAIIMHLNNAIPEYQKQHEIDLQNEGTEF
jgi:hypothetical protein